MVAAHLGIVDEEQINNMSYIFFEAVIDELGHKLIYDAIVNYAGNSFCEKSWDMIAKNNPFNPDNENGTGNNQTLRSLADFFGSADVKIKKPKGKGEKENE